VYDAEVAYQDHLLAELLDVLGQPERRENTVVIVVADHGEMLGEHQLMGHGFGVYQELIHVPFIIRLPGQDAGRRVPDLVSTTRLFHTVLDVAGQATYRASDGLIADAGGRSLTCEVQNRGVGAAVVSEAYAPEFALKIIESHRPVLIDRLYCRATNWAAYEETFKLIRIDGVEDRLYSLSDDPREDHSLAPATADGCQRRLAVQLELFVDRACARRLAGDGQERVDVDDEVVRQRLRGLGYVE
jgi:arylsulfatase A-like enzyme